MENILDLILPQRCLGCNKIGASICYKCLHIAKIANLHSCLVCEGPSIGGITHTYCASEYSPRRLFFIYEYFGLVRKVIKRSKFGEKHFDTLKVLSKDGAKTASKCGISEWVKDSVIVPIPLNKKREQDRGFNQSLIIAQALGNEFNLNIDESMLIRKRRTAFQYKFKREQRIKNVEGAFAASKFCKGKKILIVDDICTTGATLLSAAKALIKSGAKEVNCFTLAKKL